MFIKLRLLLFTDYHSFVDFIRLTYFYLLLKTYLSQMISVRRGVW